MEDAERQLVDAAAAGDPDALAAVFAQHRERLKRMIRLRMDPRLAGRVDASDVLQEAFLDVNRRIAEYPATGMPFFVWLRSLTGQRLVDTHRHHLGVQKRSASREISIHRGPIPAATSAALAAQLVGHISTASEAAIRAELKIRIQDALNSLAVIDREVLSLRHFEGLTNAEAAEVLGIGQNAASNRYVRALRRLKEVISETQDAFDSWRSPGNG